MASPHTTFTAPMFNCPACGKPLHATFHAELQISGPIIECKSVPADVKVTAMHLAHDCRPDGERPRSTLEGHGR